MADKRKREEEEELDEATQVEPSQAREGKRARTDDPESDDSADSGSESEMDTGGESDASSESGLDDEDLEAIKGKKGKKARRRLTAEERAEKAARRYIDDIADVDEGADDDDDELGDAEAVDFIDEQSGPATAAELAELRRQVAQDRGPRGVAAFEEDDVDEDAMAKRLEERYRDYGHESRSEATGAPSGSRSDIYKASYWAPGQTVGSTIEQQARKPTSSDSQMFSVPCRIGHESEAVICIMNMAITYAKNGRGLSIRSAVSPDHIRGAVYIEADKESHVKETLQGLSHLQHWKLKKVSQDDMPRVLKVVKSAALVPAGAYVRLKRGTYAGDLAQVVKGEDASGNVEIKVVPRIDYDAIAVRHKSGTAGAMRARLEAEDAAKSASTSNSNANETPALSKAADGDDVETNTDGAAAGGSSAATGKKKRRARKVRPKAKAVDLTAIQAAGGYLRRERDSSGEFGYIYNNMMFRGGYLIREASVASLVTTGVKPSIDELQRFSISGDNDDSGDEYSGAFSNQESYDSSVIESARGARSVKFNPGDSVIVADGDLRDLTGKVTKVDPANGRVTIMPALEELTDPLELDAHQLRKYFKAGTHVKVTRGKHENLTGMVVRLDNDLVYVWSDLAAQEVQVFAEDVTEASEVSAALSRSGIYTMYDLVEFTAAGRTASSATESAANHTAQEAGLVVGILPEALKVLSTGGDVQVIKNNRVMRKIHVGGGAALDSQENRVSEGDYVNVVQGPKRDSAGTVKAVWKSTAFVYSRQEVRNAGVSAVPCRYLRVGMGMNRARAGSGLLASRVGFGAMAPGAARSFGSMGGGGAGRGAGGKGAGSIKDKRKDPLMAKRIRVTGGNHKGHVGIVKDVTDVSVRVELQSKSKIVTVRRDRVVEVDGNGRPLQALPHGGRPGPEAEGRYPAPNATPRHPGVEGFDPTRTPMHSGVQAPATPGRHDTMGGGHYGDASTSYTPAMGGQTPMSGPTPAMSATTPLAGGMPYGEGEAYTPAMGGAPTPGQGMDYGGAPTPYGGAGPDTPGMGMDMSAPTPGMGMGAPTPGPGMSAPTPGMGMSAPTPGMGMGMSAPTPGMGMSAPTPGMGMSAPTPGMGMSAPTPGPGMGGSMSAPTPMGGVAPTPAAGGYQPAAQYGAPTPGMGAPTPAPGMGAPTPAGVAPTPAVGPTPGVGAWAADGGAEPAEAAPVHSATVWVCPDVEAQVTSSGPNEGVKGTIRSINAEGQVELYVAETDQVIFVPAADLRPTEPAKKDRVKVLAPADAAGRLGELVSIHQKDGIVRMEDDDDLKFFALVCLGRYLAAS